jgi:hypothetical protein
MPSGATKVRPGRETEAPTMSGSQTEARERNCLTRLPLGRLNSSTCTQIASSKLSLT